MNRLPEKFENKMHELLGDEFDAFINGFKESRFGGVRFNRMKTDKAEFEKIAPFNIKPVPWTDNGYYYDLSDTPAKHPYYYAGLYYIQEPSAMIPAATIPINPGDRVLDVCAAPGGKSTELAARLNGRGVLVSNDISNSRAKALLKNLELFGTKNAIVISEAPYKLSKVFEGYFNKILIDAPCSGEGMFRKSPQIIKNWEQYGTEYYHKLQVDIIDNVIPMLAPGGCLVYSTCTFDPSEDEGTLDYILKKFPDMHVIEIPGKYEKFDNANPDFVMSPYPEIKNAIRLWPHHIDGEGHFCALLKRDGEDRYVESDYPVKASKIPDSAKEFLEHINFEIPEDRVVIKNDRLYLVPVGVPDLKGLRVMREGLLLGEIVKNRFEPAEALACAIKPEEFDNVYMMSAGDPDTIKYLKCETLYAKTPVKDGYVLMCVDGFPLGFAKANGNTLKNKYLPGWRMM